MILSDERITEFQVKIWEYYREYGRPFPWRETDNPYHILVSELMLQQTQTSRVLNKYEAFLNEFPTYADLADAPLAKVLQLWSGLGYNRRAIGLKKIAEIVHRRYKDRLPDDPDELQALPMIGPATAGSLQAFVYNKAVAFIETNIRRVILHFFFRDAEGVSDKEILNCVQQVIDESDPRQWYYALMDYGVYLKYAVPNPNRRSAHYRRQSPFENSNRQIRGRIVALLSERYEMPLEEIFNELKPFESERIKKSLAQLVSEGFLAAENTLYRVKDS